MASGMEQFVRRETTRDFPMALEAVFTDDASVPTDEIGVQELSENEHFHPNVVWSPRLNADGTLLYPARGDRCLLVISDRNNAWVVEWTPYG